MRVIASAVRQPGPERAVRARGRERQAPRVVWRRSRVRWTPVCGDERDVRVHCGVNARPLVVG